MHERRWNAFETKKRGRIGHSSKQAAKMKMGFLPHFNEWYGSRRKIGFFMTAHEHETTIS
jgi:hypothetical protein